MKGMRDVLPGLGEATCRTKEDGRAGERERTTILCRRGRADEAPESRRKHVVIFVDDCTRSKVVKFVKKKSNATAALLSPVADYINPQKLSIKCVRTDKGGEFEGEFQRELDRRSITHEHTPPDTP